MPEFGGWDKKAGTNTNYSVVFSQARANRKQHKSDLTRYSIGNEQELLTKPSNDEPGVVSFHFIPNCNLFFVIFYDEICSAC